MIPDLATEQELKQLPLDTIKLLLEVSEKDLSFLTEEAQEFFKEQAILIRKLFPNL